ncbi:hypothetical protein Tco_0322131 [Tanacetum coccineum]
MKKDSETPLLVGRGFLATANAVIDCRMAKIAVGEGITSSVFSVKGIDLGEEEAPYWTILGKRESYKPRPSTDGIGAKPPYYARKDFIDCHLPGEWEISRDAELNPFKDTLVLRRMVSTNSNCSSSCLENVKILKEQYEQLLKDLRTSKLNAITYKTGLESVKARLLVYKKNESVYKEDIKVLKRNFMPPKPNLSFSGLEEFVNEPIVSEPTVKKLVVETSEAKASADKPKVVRKNNGAPIIED